MARELVLRFGLEGEEAHSLEQTGAWLGISREQVRQIAGRTLAILKAALSESTAEAA